MEKWEYLTITVDRTPSTRFVAGQDGVAVPDAKKGLHYSAYINELGEQGWELVASASPYEAGYTSPFQLIFKRRKP